MSGTTIANEKTSKGPLSSEMLTKMDAYWRAANYLSVGQIYLKDNPLLERPLTLDDVKPRPLGHSGTTPGLNFLLTGRRGFFSCYEALIHIVDSMVNQHAKWLKVTRQWYSEVIQRHKLYVSENGDDLPEIRNWRWPAELNS